MEKFIRLTGVAAPMPLANIDTGAMAPSALARDNMDNLGSILFGNQRRLASGEEIPDFVLNQPRYRESRIIVAGPNFGCGSSRETAVWALLGFGIRCVIASGFGDIFRDNAFQNGLLPVTLLETEIEVIMHFLEQAKDPTMTVDLEKNVVELRGRPPLSFAVPAERRAALLQGLNETEFLLSAAADIEIFQDKNRVHNPWIYQRAAPQPPLS